MQTININDRLQYDSHLLGYVADTAILLSRNALFPWFILVPNTTETEFYKLTNAQQLKQLQLINSLSGFIDNYFHTDKLNIATIGNVVSQLHIHVVGRRENDACWPGVVWGYAHSEPYKPENVELIRANLANIFTDEFVAL